MFSLMRVANMMKRGGRVFLTSENEPLGDQWPCFSFSYKKRKDVEKYLENFDTERDVLVFAGTQKKETDKEHKGRLISVAAIKPKPILDTEKIVPPERWKKSVDEAKAKFDAKPKLKEKRKGKFEIPWARSMAIKLLAHPKLLAYPIGCRYPLADEFAGEAYTSLGRSNMYLNIAEVVDEERKKAIMDLEVEPVNLSYTSKARAYLESEGIALEDLRELRIEWEVSRMTGLILNRVNRSGEVEEKTNPPRNASDSRSVRQLLERKLNEQKQLCALCDGELNFGRGNPLLQPSPDRIDSGNGAYDDANVQITHRACNLAKNRYRVEDFKAWLSVMRNVEERDE